MEKNENKAVIKMVIYKKSGMRLLKNGVGNNGLSIYLALLSLNLKNTRLIHINTIYYELTNNKNIPRQFKESIKSGIQELDKNCINIISVDKDYYEINFNKMVENIEVNTKVKTVIYDNIYKENIVKKTNYYFHVDISVVRNIYKIGGGSLITYWFKMLNLFDGIYIYPSLDELANICDISRNTVMKYNEQLLECKAIYIHKHIHKYTNTNKKLNNMYGIYENKDKIIELANNYLEENKSNIK